MKCDVLLEPSCNDNNDPNLMGPMEFAVVRNNVDKLMVNKINGYNDRPRGFSR